MKPPKELLAIDKARDRHNAPAQADGRIAMVIHFANSQEKFYGVNYLAPEDAHVGHAWTPPNAISGVVVAPFDPTLAEIQERTNVEHVAGRTDYYDMGRESRGNPLKVATMPISKTDPYTYGPVQWTNTYIPRWMRLLIQFSSDRQRIRLAEMRPTVPC